MLTPQGRVKVMDFGLAKRAALAELDRTLTSVCAQLTAQGAAIGTPDYMSPEQVTGARRPRAGFAHAAQADGHRPDRGRVATPALLSATLEP